VDLCGCFIPVGVVLPNSELIGVRFLLHPVDGICRAFDAENQLEITVRFDLHLAIIEIGDEALVLIITGETTVGGYEAEVAKGVEPRPPREYANPVIAPMTGSI